MEFEQNQPDRLDGLYSFHESLDPSTQALHADDHLNHSTDVAPPIHVATIFRYSANPEQLRTAKEIEPADHETHVYSRDSAPSTTRLETLLTALLHAPSLTYASGLSALHALYVFLKPPKIFLPLHRPGEGYHGSHAVITLHRKITGCEILDLDDEDALGEKLGEGDVLHVETPINPTGEARNIAYYSQKALAKGAIIVVDSTFAPPGLQDPFKHGADVVMHSGTKYLGGHSDMLCGVLASKKQDWIKGLREERAVLGNVMGSLEGWLGVRSIRTLGLRIQRQSESAGRLVAWLHGIIANPSNDTYEASTEAFYIHHCITRITHASLQPFRDPTVKSWLSTQMPQGYGPVFAIWMRDPTFARRLPSKLHLLTHSTSLGGVESLIEWRVMSDQTCDERLMRLSIGVEGWEDLKADLVRGCRALYDEDKERRKVEDEDKNGDKKPEKVGAEQAVVVHGEGVKGLEEAMMG